MARTSCIKTHLTTIAEGLSNGQQTDAINLAPLILGRYFVLMTPAYGSANTITQRLKRMPYL